MTGEMAKDENEKEVVDIHHPPFQPHVDWDRLCRNPDILTAPVSPGRGSLSSRAGSFRKGSLSRVRLRSRSSSHFKTAEEVDRIIDGGKGRDLKTCLRSQHWLPFDGARSRLWQAIFRFNFKEKATTDSIYWDTVMQIYGTHDLVEKINPLPTFVEPSFQISYYLNERGLQIARRIMSVISYSCPDITYAPSLYPITCILLHYMTEEEAYSCVTLMVSSRKAKYITQTKLHYETIWRTAMMLCRRHIKSTVSYMAKQSGDTATVELIHQRWLSYIFKELPFQHLIRVMDCFLCEGRKVIYRVWMAILLLFHRQLAAQSPDSRASMAKESNMETSLEQFCRTMPYSPEKLLRTAYGVRNFSSSEMDRLFIKTEMYLKSKSTQATTTNNTKGTSSGNKSIVRSRSNDVLPTSQSQVNIQMISHTLTIREGYSTPGPKTRTLGVYPIQGLGSVAVDCESLLMLWSWLPVRITMYQPEMLYTTEEHGCSMTTFFHRVEQHEPTILIVKTVTGDVFGAYCSNKWNDRRSRDQYGGRQGYFGTGETFIFTLHPNEVKYPWVGIASSSAEGPSCVRHAAELFMASDGHMITIGGGKGQAIWIDENLRYGKSDECLTFNNPQLTSTTDFEIQVLEVYGFQGL